MIFALIVGAMLAIAMLVGVAAAALSSSAFLGGIVVLFVLWLEVRVFFYYF